MTGYGRQGSLKPYRVNGVWYYPAEQPGYDKVGIASWYGPKYHGRPTASGETYDMNGLTAAHRTLPLPSRILVTNLANGRSLVLRVNDRGPFVDGRIVDVSRRAAELLGFRKAGIARVRVRLAETTRRATADRAGTVVALRGPANDASPPQSDAIHAEMAAQRSLETVPSGTTIIWSNPRTGHSGSFTPLRTFRSGSGVWCRQFRQTFRAGGGANEAQGIACRRPSGYWDMTR